MRNTRADYCRPREAEIRRGAERQPSERIAIGSPRAIIDIPWAGVRAAFFRGIFPLLCRSVYIYRREISRAWRSLTREIEPCDFVPSDGQRPVMRKRGVRASYVWKIGSAT